jgi:hypothetical protein
MISVRDDHTTNEDLQAGRAWGNLGFKIADEIDRAMCAAEGIAALQRAADLVTLADYAEAGGLVELWSGAGHFFVSVEQTLNAFVGPHAIAEAAAWVRQRGGA